MYINSIEIWRFTNSFLFGPHSHDAFIARSQKMALRQKGLDGSCFVLFFCLFLFFYVELKLKRQIQTKYT